MQASHQMCLRRQKDSALGVQTKETKWLQPGFKSRPSHFSSNKRKVLNLSVQFLSMLGRFRNLTKSLYNVNLNDEIIREVAKEYNVSPRNLGVRIKYKFLPVIHYLRSIGNRVYHAVGKVLGEYDPNTTDVYVDRGLWMRSRFSLGALRSYIKTVAEEVSHYIQHYLGKLDLRMSPLDYLRNYGSNINEIEAKRVADKVASRIMEK